MKDIGEKAERDELNKAYDEIGKTPRRFIPVPKIKKPKDERKGMD